MNTWSLRPPGEVQPYLWSWVLSVLLHVAVVGGTVGLLTDLRLAPQPEPFKWEVSFADAPTMEEGEEVQATTETALATADPPDSLTESGSTESPPVLQAAQSIEQVVPPPTPRVIAQEIPAAPLMETAAAPPQHDRATEGELIALAGQQTITESRPFVSPASSTPAELPVTEPMEPEPTPIKEPAPSSSATAPAAQVAAVARPTQSASTKKVDYGWLAETLWGQVEKLKRYPTLARINRLEGRVVLRVVIGEDGHLEELAIAQSSGHTVLDQAALETLREASPLTLKYPLGKPQIVVQVPISYRLDR